MKVLDASSIIYAWVNYPLTQFPAVWDWMAEQIELSELLIPSIALDEVRNKLPECADWLVEQKIQVLEVTNKITQTALKIKTIVGIVEDNYGAGVGENDIFIIASTKIHKGTLISDESPQPNLPSKVNNYKIPAVCKLNGVNVDCINFLDYLKGSGRVFR